MKSCRCHTDGQSHWNFAPYGRPPPYLTLTLCVIRPIHTPVEFQQRLKGKTGFLRFQDIKTAPKLDPSNKTIFLLRMRPKFFTLLLRKSAEADLLPSNFNVAGSSLHPHQKSPSACTTLKIRRGGEACHHPTHITMFASHYLSIV